MNLYEINSQIMAAFEAAVDMETGEIINEAAYEALNGLQMEREEKIEGILLWIKNLTADANALKREKQAFADRQAAAERKAESLKRYVADALAGEKFQTERVSVTWRKSEAAEFTGNIALLPPPCIRVKTEVSLEELKRKLKEGAIIPARAWWCGTTSRSSRWHYGREKEHIRDDQRRHGRCGRDREGQEEPAAGIHVPRN